MGRSGMIMASILAFLILGAGTGRAADRSPPGAVSQGSRAVQRTPASAADLNRIPVRIQPRSIQAKLQAALGDVEKSEQALKAAVAAMMAYCDKEAACAGKSWTVQEMEQGCLPQDTLKACKEKLVAACAAPAGPGKAKLWENVQSAATDLSKKALAVNAVYGGGTISLPPGLSGGLSVF